MKQLFQAAVVIMILVPSVTLVEITLVVTLRS